MAAPLVAGAAYHLVSFGPRRVGCGLELPDARIVAAADGDELPEVIAEAASGARILSIVGGDGSVQLAAGLAADKGLPLLVVPAGTFNHFATDLSVRSAEDALDALRAGDSVLVDLALAGQRTFLNTASTGVYVDLCGPSRSWKSAWASGRRFWWRWRGCCGAAVPRTSS